MSDNILQAIDNLITAVGQLTQSMNNQNIVLTATATSSCSCIVGDAPDGPDTGEEGGDVPEPVGDITYSEPAEIDERKCKAADYLVDWLVDEIFRDILVAHNVKQLAGIGLALALGTVGALIGAQAGFAGSVIGGIAGLILGAIAALFDVNLDVEQIESVMQDAKQDLICALYLATTVEGAKANFQQVLVDTEQLSSAEIAFVMLWLPNALLNVLFFDITSPIDSAAFFDGYTPVIGCEACVQQLDIDWMLLPQGFWPGVTTAEGTVGVGSVSNTGDQFVITAVEKTNQPGFYAIGLVVKGFWESQSNKSTLTANNCAFHSGVLHRHDGASSWNALQGRRCTDGTSCSGVPNTDQPAAAPGALAQGMMAVYYQRNVPFSLTFSVTTQPTPC